MSRRWTDEAPDLDAETASAHPWPGKAEPVSPSKFQQAYAAFHQELPAFLARGLVGQWALYDGSTLVETHADRDYLYRRGQDEMGLPDDEIYVELIAPAPQDIDYDSLICR